MRMESGMESEEIGLRNFSKQWDFEIGMDVEFEILKGTLRMTQMIADQKF